MLTSGSNRRSSASIIAMCLALSLTVFVFIPGDIFFSNSLDFSNFRFIEALPFLLALAIGTSLTLYVAMYFLPQRAYFFCFSFLCGTAILTWVQGYFFVWDYGRLDGSPIAWDRFTRRGIGELAFWVVGLGVSIRYVQQINKTALKIATVIILAQVANLANLATRLPSASFKNYTIDDEEKFAFGTERNIVILVVDTFQSDIFQEIIQADPEWKDVFAGFTYFPDAISAFPTTYASIAQILTGELYDNSVPFQEFLERAFTSSPSSLPVRLSEVDYRVEFYPLAPKLVWMTPQSVNNLKPRRPQVLRTDLSMNFVANVGLLELSVFRIAPHYLKRMLFEKRGFSPPPHHGISDLNFLKASNQETRLSNASSKVFKYFHLLGAHAPFILNETLEEEHLPLSREGYLRQSKATLLIVRTFMENLKKAKAFEKAMVIVTGDHGFFTQFMGIYQDQAVSSAIPGKIRAAASPLLLAKLPNSVGPLVINRSEVTLSDISTTILKEEGLTVESGYSVFDQIPTGRTRKFRYFDNGIDGNYLTPLTEYTIVGPSGDAQSWRDTTVTYSRP